jgi:UPF0176 protein
MFSAEVFLFYFTFSLSMKLSMENSTQEESKKEFLILAYYLYAPVEKPELFREEHLIECVNLDIRGRIIVAHEGINGTVSGRRENCETYMANLNKIFDGKIDFKVHEHHEHAFNKINVRVKPEIVHSGLTKIDPNRSTGKYLSAEEFKALKNEEGVVILDVRSNYEHKLGRFKGAITLDIENFREFPEKIKELEQLKGKKVITYCTGGIKCEKASAFLLENGFEDVYQLHGGIIKYGLEGGGEDFEGQCYVFDGRVAVDVNTVNPVVISRCVVCDTPSKHMVNCANPHCNLHAPICEDCMVKNEGCCSDDCKNNPDRRPYNMQGYYTRKQNGYNPLIGWKKVSKRTEV